MKFLSDILAKSGLVVDGVVTLNSVSNATTDTDKFLTVDSGVVKYRTGAQLLSDIGGQPAGSYVPYVVSTNITGGLNGALSITGLYMFDGYGSSVPNSPDNSWNVSLFHIGNASRGLQLAGSYDNNNLYFRKGNETWQSWQRVVTTSILATDYDYDITGTKNGTNKVFTLSSTFVSGTTRVFVNGIRYTRGAGYDYVETGTNQITFTNAPDAGDLITVDYIKP